MQAAGGAPLTGAEDGSGPPTRDPVIPAQRRLGLVLVVAGLVLVLDQASKSLVVATMPGRPKIELLDGLLAITHVRNSGAAFSVGTGFTWIFTAVALAVSVILVRTARQLTSRAWAVALGGLLGGAVGNLVDRLLRSPGRGRGYVVDWIELPHWPVFNLADSAIVGAAALIVVLSLSGRDLSGALHRG